MKNGRFANLNVLLKKTIGKRSKFMTIGLQLRKMVFGEKACFPMKNYQKDEKSFFFGKTVKIHEKVAKLSNNWGKIEKNELLVNKDQFYETLLKINPQ